MKITVAVPCYNLEDRISTCLESIVSQDYNDLEILVIDDHSTDQSVNVVYNLIKENPEREFRFIVNETNQGLCSVRNLAINEATGDSLFFVDGDDTIEPGTLSLLYQRMVKNNVDAVYGSFRKKDFEGNTYVTKQFPGDTVKGEFAYAKYAEHYFNGFIPLEVWNNLYRLEFIKANEIYCSTHYRIWEDRLFTFKVALSANSISFVRDITYNYIDAPNSITRQRKGKEFLQNYKDVLCSIVETKKEFESKHNYKALPPCVRFLYNYLFFTDGLLKLSMESEASRREKKDLLRWLRRLCKKENINRKNIVRPYNRVSYFILKAPFSYVLFRLYFMHLKKTVKVVDLSDNVKKRINKFCFDVYVIIKGELPRGCCIPA